MLDWLGPIVIATSLLLVLGGVARAVLPLALHVEMPRELKVGP